MGKKKKFIDKKNSVTFRLVHRSQKDPLAADETAPQHVLQPVNKGNEASENKYGLYEDDDYNYLQHLKERTVGSELVEVFAGRPSKKIKDDSDLPQTKTLILPSSVFPSDVEEKVGLLNKAAQKTGLQLDLDPDVVAAMDDDFDFDDPENVLEDDFVQLANGGGLSDIPEDDLYEEEFDIDDCETIGRFQLSNHDGDDDEDYEDTRTRFSEYSLSSSVMRRTDQLTMLDDRFEQMYAEYDDNEIGALDCEEIEGSFDPSSEVLTSLADEYERRKTKEERLEKAVAVPYETLSSDSDSGESLVEVKPKEKWDCESILSTYSNIYNHPKLISAPPSNRIKLNRKTGMPLDENKLTMQALTRLDKETTTLHKSGPGSLVSAVSTLSIRPKDESNEDRRARKLAFREYKKERRTERKLNKEAFKEEKKTMEKMMARNKSKNQIPLF